MTANKFKKGDAVRPLIDVDKKIGMDKKTKYIIEEIIDNQTVKIGLWKVSTDILELWSDKLQCHYCGAEIVIKYTYGKYTAVDTQHNEKCPCSYLSPHSFDNKQEALDAYSMKWEG
jgi:hypothetical protein